MKKFFILLCAVIAFFPKFSIAAIVLNTNDGTVQVTPQKNDFKFQALNNELKSEQKLERKLRRASRIIKFLGIEKLEKRFLGKTEGGSDSDKVVGILLGFGMGLLGVIISLFIKNKTITHYAWVGFGIYLAVFLLTILIILAVRK